MVSAACPECHILLVEASGEDPAETAAAVEEAAKLKATEISNSYGYSEDDESACPSKKGCKEYLAAYDQSVPVMASAGDGGYDNKDRGYSAPLWPAVSPNVIAVGGTELTKVEKPKEGERAWKEVVWPDSGSGCSLYESEPTWQEAKTVPKACGTDRTDNDVASVAEEVSIYTTPYEGGWGNVGGTSASSPFVAGVEAHATSATKKLGADAFYKKPSMLFHISEGSNGTCTPPAEDEYLCHATKEGYNGPTGEGTPDGVFTSTGPTAVTGSATSITKTGATLNGTVNPNGVETKYYFEYGETTSYGNKTAEASAGAGTSNVEESKAITGLTAGKQYDFRIVATNTSKETSEGANQVFTTTKAGPKVETKPASDVTETTATLNGAVNPEGKETKYYFEYGTTKSYGTKTAEASAGSGTSNVEESKAITGLTAGTEYHFRIVAKNSEGTTEGLDQVVKTRSWSVQETPNPKELTNNGASLSDVSCTSSTSCMAAGQFEPKAEDIVPLTESWNGTAWAVQEPPNPTEGKASYLTAVSCTSSTACTAVGYFSKTYAKITSWMPYAERWNGTAWSFEELPTLTGGTYTYLEGVSCTSSEACIAVGITFSSSKEVMLVDRWNGKAWSTEEPPVPTGVTKTSLASVSCSASAACTAVGSFKNSSGEWMPLAERWNGTKWAVQEPPNPTGSKERFLEGVSCASSTACTAVGYLFNSSDEDVPFVESWNGTAWSVQEAPSPKEVVKRSFRYLLLNSVSCTSSTECVAVGYFDNSSEKWVSLSETWNGTAWTAQEPPSPTGSGNYVELHGVSCTGAITCTGVGGNNGVTLAELYH